MRRWRQRLGGELRTADRLRRLVARCTDAEIDRLARADAADDLRGLVRRTARFNWHRELILALGRQPAIAGLFLQGLFR